MLKGPQSPQTLKNSLPSDIYLDKYSTNQFHDDIECKSWLEEVGLSQYCETFLANFHVGGNLLSRNRLKQVRLYHFPHMNITRYDHAKVLMEHIRHTLQFQFDSPMRRNEVSKRLNSATNSVAFPPILGAVDNTPSNNHLPTQRLADLHVDGTKKRANHKSASNLRRKTFDSKAWQSITKFRRQSIIDSNQSVVLDNLREGKTEIVKEPVITKATRRYSTLVLSDDIIVDNNLISTRSSKALATAYGNMALEQNMLQQQLKKLQNDQLAYYKNIINCELANIFFVNETKRELMLFVQDVWYKLSMETGIAGYTARTGESLNIIDAYADPRFNQEMDKKTGLVTRNILCTKLKTNTRSNYYS